jgi:hypothetical protein
LPFLGRCRWRWGVFVDALGYPDYCIVHDTDINGFGTSDEDIGEGIMSEYLTISVIISLEGSRVFISFTDFKPSLQRIPVKVQNRKKLA